MNNANYKSQKEIRPQVVNEADRDFIPYLEMILEAPETPIQQTTPLIEKARAGKEAEIVLEQLRSSGILSETVHGSLLRTIRTGKNAIDSLIEARLGVVAHLAILHQGKGVSLEDLFQEGCIKLTEAAHDMIGREEAIDPQHLYRIMYGRVKSHLRSLVKEAEKSEKYCCSDAGIATQSVFFVSDDDFSATVEKVLSTLAPREEKVMKLYYGIGQYPLCKSFEQVGQHLNVGGARIQQIHAKALRKLRHPSRANLLRVYLEDLA